MGKIILSCGHEDPRKPFGFVLFTRDEVCDPLTGFTSAIRSGSYCSKCASSWIALRPEEVWTEHWQAEESIFGKA